MLVPNWESPCDAKEIADIEDKVGMSLPVMKPTNPGHNDIHETDGIIFFVCLINDEFNCLLKENMPFIRNADS